jgi:methyl-accepting chemotaxis protein
MGQINAAMDHLNEITQQNAASSERLTATAEAMRGQAQDLHQMIGFFSVAQAQEAMLPLAGEAHALQLARVA